MRVFGLKWRKRRAARRDGDRGGSLVEGLRQQVDRVVRQPARAGRRLGPRRNHGHAVARDHDLSPTDPIGVRAILERDRGGARVRRRRPGDEFADRAQRLEPAGPGQQLQADVGQPQRHRPAVHLQNQIGCERVATRLAGDGKLGRAHGAVAVGVEALLLGEGRYLGHVDNHVELDLALPHSHLRVVVDREVTQRVCGRGSGENGRRGGRRCRGESHSPEPAEDQHHWPASIVRLARVDRARAA